MTEYTCLFTEVQRYGWLTPNALPIVWVWPTTQGRHRYHRQLSMLEIRKYRQSNYNPKYSMTIILIVVYSSGCVGSLWVMTPTSLAGQPNLVKCSITCVRRRRKVDILIRSRRKITVRLRYMEQHTI